MDIDPVPWATLQLIYSDYEWRPQNTSLPLSDSKMRIYTARYLPSSNLFHQPCIPLLKAVAWLQNARDVYEETGKSRDERFELQNSSGGVVFLKPTCRQVTACCCRIQPFHKETKPVLCNQVVSLIYVTQLELFIPDLMCFLKREEVTESMPIQV